MKKMNESEKVIAEFEELLQKGFSGKHIKTVFSDFLFFSAMSLVNSYDKTCFDEREYAFEEVKKNYSEAEMDTFTTMFSKIIQLGILQVSGDIPYMDYLGDIYSRCVGTKRGLGQVFTPYHIAKLMASLVVSEDDLTNAREGKVLQFADPACGSGVMAIAMINELAESGVNTAHNMFIKCADIDIDCTLMTFLQLSLLGVPAIVLHKNALTMEEWDRFRTPALVFQLDWFTSDAEIVKLAS